MWAGESMDDMFKRIAKFGYDGVEILGEPDKMNINEVKDLLKKHNLECSTICSVTAGDKQISSLDPKILIIARTHLGFQGDFDED